MLKCSVFSGACLRAPLLSALFGVAFVTNLQSVDGVLVIPIRDNLGQDNGSYRLDYSPPHGKPAPNTTFFSREIGPSINSSEALPGTRYEFNLYYSNSTINDRFTWNTSIATVPDPPTNLNVTVRGGKSALVSWSPPVLGHYSGFKMLVKPLFGDPKSRSIELGEGESPYTLRELTPGGTYQIQLFTVFGDKESIAYTSRNFTTNDGRTNENEAQTLTSNKPTLGEFPWYTRLYLRIKDETFKHVCGGTLISPHIVLTAAHCVYLGTLLSKRNESDLKVAVGKINHSWHIEEPKEQRRDVREIIISAKYEGSSRNADDIALLDLVSSVVLSEVTMPASLDRGLYVPPVGRQGVVVGLGETENEALSSAQLSYIPDDECRRKTRLNFHKFMTYDKFCAGWSNGTGLEAGSSGGGLIFWNEERNQFTVYGVLSFQSRQEASFALFTNVSAHVKWIDQVSKAFMLKHPQRDLQQ